MSEPIYSRAPDVVWRLGPDRVLVRRIGGHGQDAGSSDVIGLAGLVWIVLDEPGTTGEIGQRISLANALECSNEEEVEHAVLQLVDEGLVGR